MSYLRGIFIINVGPKSVWEAEKLVKKIVNHLAVTNRQQFRKWLATHYQDATECWVDVKRGVPKPDGTFGMLMLLKKLCVLDGLIVHTKNWLRISRLHKDLFLDRLGVFGRS